MTRERILRIIKCDYKTPIKRVKEYRIRNIELMAKKLKTRRRVLKLSSSLKLIG